MTTGNAINVSNAGIVGYTGSAFVETAATQHAVLVGGSTSSTITNVSVGATGTVLAGATGADPSFTAAPTVTSITLSGGTALNTYVQNTFTPVLAFGGGSTGITYSTQSGEYTQIGNLVTFSILIVLTSKGSSTGAATISLPIADGGTNSSCASGRFSTLTLTANYTEAGASISSQLLNLYQSGSAQTAVVIQDTNFANSTGLYISGFYFTS